VMVSRLDLEIGGSGGSMLVESVNEFFISEESGSVWDRSRMILSSKRS
jgi:hypothetical protein